MNCGYIVVINVSMRNTRHLEGEGKHIRSEVVLMISSPGKGEAGHSAPWRDSQPLGRHPRLKENLREGRQGCQSWERKARSAYYWTQLGKSVTKQTDLACEDNSILLMGEKRNPFIQHTSWASLHWIPSQLLEMPLSSLQKHIKLSKCPMLTHTRHGTGELQTWRAFEIKLLEPAGNRHHLSHGTPREEADISSLCRHQKVGRNQGFYFSSSSQQEKTSGDSTSPFSPFIHSTSYAKKLLLTFSPETSTRSTEPWSYKPPRAIYKMPRKKGEVGQKGRWGIREKKARFFFARSENKKATTKALPFPPDPLTWVIYLVCKR